MEILVAASLPRFPLPPQISRRHRKSRMPQFLNCSRNIGESNGLSRAPIQREVGSLDNVKNHSKSIGEEKEEKKQIDIWQLFEEAQQNILHLNKQRLLAMEELERVKNERNSLLDRIEQLEMKKQATAKKDKITISSELLLRIDALVLNGVIGSTEASDLRRLVIDSRGSLSADLYDIIHKNDAEFLAELRHFSKTSKGNVFHIIHICTEMSPVVSVGSLAPYITGLSCALQRKGNLVEHHFLGVTSKKFFQEQYLDRAVLLQEQISENGTLLYGCLNLDEVHGLREVEAEFYSYFNGQLHGNKIWTGVVCGIGVTFIKPVDYSSFFSHDKVYGCSNDFERFTYFSRASLDYLVKSGKRPDVLHIHNWQTSIVGPLFWDVFVNQGFESTRIILTCQGFDSQSLEQPEKVALCGLDPSRLLRPDRLQDNNKSHLVNVLKGGVVYSNKVIMMSSVHTKGQIISVLGHGLEPTLAMHKEKLVIAPSGFDKSTWDPASDIFLPQNYSADDMKGKSVCKFALQRHLGLDEGASKILVGCIYSGFSDVDLDKLKRLVWMASSKGVQFIFMGSGQIPGIRRTFEIFQDEVKDKNVRFIDEYDEELSHLIISGSDIMLCPSFDDHVHHVPVKAIKYGAAPIPVNFGDNGLRQFGNDSSERSRFFEYINSAFGGMSVDEAIDEIKNNPSEWNTRIKDGMGKDFSWDSECVELHISAYQAVKNL